jgi:hypothetical protein
MMKFPNERSGRNTNLVDEPEKGDLAVTTLEILALAHPSVQWCSSGGGRRRGRKGCEPREPQVTQQIVQYRVYVVNSLLGYG